MTEETHIYAASPESSAPGMSAATGDIEQASATRARRAVLKKSAGAIGLVILGAVLGALFARNPNWFPEFRYKPPHIYLGEASYKVARARTEATLSAPIGHTFASGRPLHILGYCIGGAVLDPVTKELDQRWLVLRDGLLLPMPYANVSNALPLRSCIEKSSPIGGPSGIRLRAVQRHGILSLAAISPQATTIAFALLNARDGHWRPFALLPASAQPVRVRLRAHQVAEAMTVACWGPAQPASPSDGGAVRFLQPLADESAALERRGGETSAAAATAACSIGQYGVFPLHPPRLRKRRPNRPRVSPAPAVRTASGTATDQSERSVPEETSVARTTRSPSPQTSSTSTPGSQSSKIAPAPKETTSPEESVGVGHRE